MAAGSARARGAAALGADLRQRVPHSRARRSRFGLDPILGLIPGLGDLASPVFSLFFIWHGARLRVPKVVLARMVLNALIDAAVGRRSRSSAICSTSAWKANAWNLALLERHAMPGRRATRGDYVFVILCGW